MRERFSLSSAFWARIWFRALVSPVFSAASVSGNAEERHSLGSRHLRSSRSQAGVWSGPPGARSTGCAICALPAARRSPCAAGKKKYERPSWTRRSELGSFATSLVLSRDPSRSGSGSFASSMGSISTIRWKRPRVELSSNSSHFDRRRLPATDQRTFGVPGWTTGAHAGVAPRSQRFPRRISAATARSVGSPSARPAITPSMSSSSRFWLSLRLASRRVIRSSRPTIALACDSM
jgi:hypothetical protein